MSAFDEGKPVLPRPAFAILQGGPFGEGGGLGISLKKREKKRFVDSEVGSSSQTPTERLRQIDLLRLYTPLPEERKELRIPESIERLNLVEVKHLLLLCGGCSLVRFAPEVGVHFPSSLHFTSLHFNTPCLFILSFAAKSITLI